MLFLIYWNNKNPNRKKILGFRNLHEKLENMQFFFSFLQIKEAEPIPDKEEIDEIIPEREYKQVQEELITEKMEKMTFESGTSLVVFSYSSWT